MKTIHKFHLSLEDIIKVSIPKSAKVLSFNEQINNLYIWALVDTENEIETRKFRLVGTGHPINPTYGYKYIGAVHNFQQRGLVFHLFEIQ